MERYSLRDNNVPRGTGHTHPFLAHHCTYLQNNSSELPHLYRKCPRGKCSKLRRRLERIDLVDMQLDYWHLEDTHYRQGRQCMSFGQKQHRIPRRIEFEPHPSKNYLMDMNNSLLQMQHFRKKSFHQHRPSRQTHRCSRIRQGISNTKFGQWRIGTTPRGI